MQLRKRGLRPQLGDSVVIAKADDPRDGEEATVVQDDRDAQPFRLRFADSELSMVFYREHHVKLSEATRRRRAEEEGEACEAGGDSNGGDSGGSSSGAKRPRV